MTVLALPFPRTSCWRKHMAILETERTSKDMPGKEGRGMGKGGREQWLMLEGVGHDRQREDRRVGAASGQGGEKGHSPLHSVVAYQALREVRWINILFHVSKIVWGQRNIYLSTGGLRPKWRVWALRGFYTLEVWAGSHHFHKGQNCITRKRD